MVTDGTAFIVFKRNSYLNEFKIRIVLGIIVRKGFHVRSLYCDFPSFPR